MGSKSNLKINPNETKSSFEPSWLHVCGMESDVVSFFLSMYRCPMLHHHTTTSLLEDALSVLFVTKPFSSTTFCTQSLELV